CLAVVLFLASRATRDLLSFPTRRSSDLAGWALVAVAAVVWQARSLLEIWPQRDVALHGLGGPAAIAAMTADRVGADAIYVASIRSEEHTSELQSRGHLVCRLLLEKKKTI